MKEGNILIIGEAGCGKTRYINKNFDSIKLGTTGMAASGLNSVTLHSFFALGLGNKTVEDSFKNMKEINKELIKITKTIVIDECFMLSNTIVNKVDTLLKMINKNDILFGGKRIVFVGDDAQLLAVEDPCDVKKYVTQTFRLKYGKKSRLREDYVDICREVRYGGELDISKFSKKPFKNSINVYFTNNEVKKKNIDYLKKGKKNIDLFYEGIKYSKGMRIMLTKNIDIERGLYNGRICSLIRKNEIIVDGKNIIINLNSSDIIPGAAFTIHKVQGSTLRNINIYINKNEQDFNRLLYVAITRVRRAEMAYVKFL